MTLMHSGYNTTRKSLSLIVIKDFFHRITHSGMTHDRFKKPKLLEASHPLAATTNSGVVTSGEDATDHVTDYYDILQNIVE
jgi:hypothetical protein